MAFADIEEDGPRPPITATPDLLAPDILNRCGCAVPAVLRPLRKDPDARLRRVAAAIKDSLAKQVAVPEPVIAKDCQTETASHRTFS